MVVQGRKNNGATGTSGVYQWCVDFCWFCLENPIFCLSSLPQRHKLPIIFFEKLHVTKEERPWNKGQRSALWVSGWLTANLSLSCLTQAMVGQECVGAIVCKLDMHKKMFRRGYIAMLAVDSKHRRKSIGEICLCLARNKQKVSLCTLQLSPCCAEAYFYTLIIKAFNANWWVDKLDAPDWSVTLSTWAEQECCFSKSSCYICATDFRLFFFRY